MRGFLRFLGESGDGFNVRTEKAKDKNQNKRESRVNGEGYAIC